MVSIFGLSRVTKNVAGVRLFALVTLCPVAILTAQVPSNGLLATNRTENTPVVHDLSPEMRGDILMARKMFREAVEMYQTAPKDNAAIANKTGLAYHQMLEIETARKWYERAIKLKPDYAEAINNLGAVNYQRKSFRKAVNLYKKALRLTPENASIHSNLGTAYFARKNYDKAFEEYQAALLLDPEVFEHKSSHGILLQERSVEDRARFHFFLAKTYAKAGQVDRAMQYIRKALEEGFKERDKFTKEPEFTALRELPEFKELMTAEYKVL
ncbi:MAG: tetratricopeptide repeat protein [Bryobacteraceae bacterium]